MPYYGHAAYAIVDYDADGHEKRISFCDGNFPKYPEFGNGYGEISFDIDPEKLRAIGGLKGFFCHEKFKTHYNNKTLIYNKGSNDFLNVVSEIAVCDESGKPKITEKSIKTPAQNRGNCGIKSYNIALRSMLKRIDPDLSFERRGEDGAVDKEYRDYKQYKSALLEKAFERIFKIINDEDSKYHEEAVEVLKDAFLKACSKGDIEILDKILPVFEKKGVDISTLKNKKGQDAFLSAMSGNISNEKRSATCKWCTDHGISNKYDLTKTELLENFSHLITSNTYGKNNKVIKNIVLYNFHECLYKDDTDGLKKIFENLKRSVDAKSIEKDATTMVSRITADPEMDTEKKIKFLDIFFKNGASIHSDGGVHPLQHAVIYEDAKLLEYLLSKKSSRNVSLANADLLIRDSEEEKYYPLFFVAVESSPPEIVQLMIAHKANVNLSYTTKSGEVINPLLLAAESGRVDICNIILSSKNFRKDAEVLDAVEKTAEKLGHSEIVDLMQETKRAIEEGIGVKEQSKKSAADAVRQERIRKREEERSRIAAEKQERIRQEELLRKANEERIQKEAEERSRIAAEKQERIKQEELLRKANEERIQKEAEERSRRIITARESSEQQRKELQDFLKKTERLILEGVRRERISGTAQANSRATTIFRPTLPYYIAEKPTDSERHSDDTLKQKDRHTTEETEKFDKESYVASIATSSKASRRNWWDLLSEAKDEVTAVKPIQVTEKTDQGRAQKPSKEDEDLEAVRNCEDVIFYKRDKAKSKASTAKADKPKKRSVKVSATETPRTSFTPVGIVEKQKPSSQRIL